MMSIDLVNIVQYNITLDAVMLGTEGCKPVQWKFNEQRVQ